MRARPKVDPDKLTVVQRQILEDAARNTDGFHWPEGASRHQACKRLANAGLGSWEPGRGFTINAAGRRAVMKG